MAVELSASTRLLVFAPHPDDETIATGVLLQRVLAAGGLVRVVHLTDGDNNPWPQRWLERRVWIGAPARARWGERRRGEAEIAAQRLGLPAGSVHAWHWPDGDLLGGLRDPSGSARRRIAAALADWRPTLVAMPGLGDAHPDHSTAHVLVRLAMCDIACRAEVLCYLVHGHMDAASVAIDGTPTLNVAKQAAMSAYASQLALSGTRMRVLASRPERYVPCIDDGEKAGDRLPWRPALWQRPWLRLLVADAAGTRDWPWRQAPLRRDEGGAWRLQAPSTPGPRFARLYARMPSPWIFDHWGWRQL